MRIGGIVLVALGVVIVALYLWPAFHDPADQLDDLAEHGCEAGSPLAGWWRLSPHADVPISCDTGCPDQQEAQIVRFERKLGGTWELATAVVVPTSCEPAAD